MDTLFMKQQRLSKRLRKNFNDYKATMLKMNRQELFDHAPEITAYQITCRHMGHVSQYDERSLNYLLKFENPLQVVTDHFKQDMRADLNAIIDRSAIHRIYCKTILLCRLRNRRNRSDDLWQPRRYGM